METVNVHQVLEDLTFEYIETGESAIFARLLTAIDNLLKFVIARLRYAHPYLKSIEFYDLYQASIVGVYQAISRVRPEESGSKIIYRIIHGVGDEIIKEYKDRSWRVSGIPFDRVVRENLVDFTPVYAELEMKFMLDRFTLLTEEGILTEQEFREVIDHYVHGITLTDIARLEGNTYPTISKRVKKAITRIRREFRRRDWEVF